MSKELGPVSPDIETVDNPVDIVVASALGDISLASERRQIDVFLDDSENYIRVATNKKVPLKLPREHIDYADYRRGFVRAVAARQSLTEEPHQSIKPLEAWADMGMEGRFPTDIMIGVKKWLPYLSHYRQQLIESNGKRGRGALYAVNNDYYLNIIEPRKEVEPILPEPLTRPELYEVVRHLAQFDFVFKDHNVLGIDPMLELQLQQFRPDYPTLRDEGISIADFRSEAKAKFRLLLKDKAYKDAFRLTNGAKPIEASLLKYINDLDAMETHLVEQLLFATLEPISYGGKSRLEAVDSRGMILGILEPRAAEKETDNLEDRPAEVTFDRTDPEETVAVKGHQETQNNTRGGEEVRERIDSLLSIIQAVANDTAARYLVNLNADKTYRLARLVPTFPNLTVAKLVSAKSNNVINTTKDQPISLEDVIRITLYSDPFLKNIFTTRKYKSRIDSIIRQAIEENIERVERELSGEDD